MSRAAQSAMTIEMDHVLVTTLIRPVMLPAGSQTRGLPCLICAEPIGAGPADQIVLWPVAGQGCYCGRVEVVAFLVHADHQTPSVADLVRLTRERLQSGHPFEDSQL